MNSYQNIGMFANRAARGAEHVNIIVIMMSISFMVKTDEDHDVEMGGLMTKDQDVCQPL